MAVLADSLPTFSSVVFDVLRPLWPVLASLFGLKLAIELGPTIFKRICNESFHSQLSPIMMPIMSDEGKEESEYGYFNTTEADYYVECQVCHTDMSDEVYFEVYDDTRVHVCNYCSGVK